MVAVNNRVKYSQDYSILYLLKHAFKVIWRSEALRTMVNNLGKMGSMVNVSEDMVEVLKKRSVYVLILGLGMECCTRKSESIKSTKYSIYLRIHTNVLTAERGKPNSFFPAQAFGLRGEGTFPRRPAN